MKNENRSEFSNMLKPTRRLNVARKTKPGVYQIFLSHKHSPEDTRLAHAFRKTLEALYRRKVKVFIAEDIVEGGNWPKLIFDALRESSEFVLLYSDNTLGWDWPMFEAGSFSGYSNKQERPMSIICHHLVAPPETFFDLQHVLIDPSSHSRAANKQPRAFFRNLHHRILGINATTESWDRVQNDTRFRSLCSDISASVGQSADLTTANDNEIGFTVELCPKYAQGNKQLAFFEPTKVQVNRQWEKRFGNHGVPNGWKSFMKQAASYIDVPPLFSESLALWARLDADLIEEKPRLGCCKLKNHATLLRPIVAHSTRLLNGGYRLYVLLLKPSLLSVDSSSTAPNLFQAELFMARSRSFLYDGIEPSKNWIAQFLGRSNLRADLAELCLLAIECVLTNTQHEFSARGFCEVDSMELIASKNQLNVKALFEREKELSEDLRKRCSTPGFNLADVQWLKKALDDYSEIHGKLLLHATDALGSALRSAEVFPQKNDSLPKRWWEWKLF